MHDASTRETFAFVMQNYFFFLFLPNISAEISVDSVLLPIKETYSPKKSILITLCLLQKKLKRMIKHTMSVHSPSERTSMSTYAFV